MKHSCLRVKMAAVDMAVLLRLFKQGDTIDAVLKYISEAGEAALAEIKPDGSSLLHSFALLGSYEVVRLLWERGARPSFLKQDHSTLLHSAVRSTERAQDEERAKILGVFLSSKANCCNSMPINHANNGGWTALKLAAKMGLERCVEVLLEHGADPNCVDSEGYTALHSAVGNADVVKLLVSRVGGLDGLTEDGETALYLASEKGLVASALTLLEHRANPNLANKDGITPLFLAARGGYLDIARETLRQGANVNACGGEQRIGPLHWAAHKELEEMAVLLIEAGADISLKDKQSRTPIVMASPELAAKMIATARKVTPDLSAPSIEPVASAECKALAACCGGNIPGLRALLQAGVSVNHCGGTTKATLLHMAAYCGQLPMVLFLLREGADASAVDQDSDTVLHFACRKAEAHGQHDRLLELLLSATPIAALKDNQNSRGETAIMLATKCKFVSRVKILLQHGASVSVANSKKELPLHRACSSDESIEIVLYFAELAESLDVQDCDGWTPLMSAVKGRAAAVVKYLVQRGVDVNCRQSKGYSALYLAAQEESAGICRTLLEGGADPQLAGGRQKLTPLHIAAHKSCKSVCALLIHFGGDINQKDIDGDTPLMLARDQELRGTMMAMAASRDIAAARIEGVVTNEPCPTPASNENPDTRKTCNEENTAKQEEEEEDEEEEEEGRETEGKPQRQSSKEGETGGKPPRQSSKEGEGSPQECASCQELRQDAFSQSQQLASVQSELEATQHEKDMILSRNRCLKEELEQLEEKVQKLQVYKELREGGGGGGSPTGRLREAWWMVGMGDYTVEGEQLNARRCVMSQFFKVYAGSFHHMSVAVKCVRNVSKWTAEIYSTFSREMDLLSRLQCPYLVQFLAGCIDVGSRSCMLITELMSRGSLEQVLHIDRIPLDWNTRLRMVHDVCCGMAFLHSHKVLHKCLVPRNVLIGEHFNAKVSDYGLWETKETSNFFEELRSRCTKPQVYMAPEAMERFEFTAAADVYSFGIIMCEAATGQKPFTDLCVNNPVCMVMKLVMGVRPSFNGGVPSAYRSVTEKCWAGDPDLRPSFPDVQKQLAKLC